MVRAGEIEHSELIAERAEEVWRRRSAAGRVRAQRRARLIIDAADIIPGSDVLEIGCGTGGRSPASLRKPGLASSRSTYRLPCSIRPSPAKPPAR
jgi:hypothetical protein